MKGMGEAELHAGLAQALFAGGGARKGTRKGDPGTACTADPVHSACASCLWSHCIAIFRCAVQHLSCACESQKGMKQKAL